MTMSVYIVFADKKETLEITFSCLDFFDFFNLTIILNHFFAPIPFSQGIKNRKQPTENLHRRSYTSLKIYYRVDK